MARYIIKHERENCISCGACWGHSPQFWKQDDKDGKSKLIGGKETGKDVFELEIDEKDFSDFKEVAESCPMNIIHIINKENDEKII